MSNVLDETKQQQLIALGRLGWSLRRIEAATGVRRETISGHLKAAGVAVRRRGGRVTQWPPPDPATTAPVSTDPVAADHVDTGSRVAPGRAPTASACEPYRDLIVEGVRRGRNAMAIWQDLVDGHGFPGRYASVRRFVGRLRGATTPEPAGIITTDPGEEAQVDYGEGPMVRDPATGKYRRTRLFVLTLGYSRKSVRLLTWRSSSQRWAELHEEAFRRLGGTTRVVLDKLREGVLDARLRHAQAERLPPLDFLAMLVTDELQRRQDRLLDRRRTQARFRDPSRSLDAFDFTFNRKMNRALLFELATGRFITEREDVLLLGPPGTGKSHLAQALGQAAINQGHRVLYREAHPLLEELTDATLDGTRKEVLTTLSTVPLLIIDDLGMRKLPPTAAEDLLELIMRRYERASTLLTSNRLVDDWGKLLGDTAAVTALLDRLLHHAHVLTCGPRSWRTKLHPATDSAVAAPR